MHNELSCFDLSLVDLGSDHEPDLSSYPLNLRNVYLLQEGIELGLCKTGNHYKGLELFSLQVGKDVVHYLKKGDKFCILIETP